MSEVSSWSATDASNNLTPPDGWPEGMQPSGVNNVGRMMMGAIARWYSTVTAAVASCMPISGGTFTGPIVAPQITSTGNINATFDIGAGRNMFATGTLSAGSVHSSGDISANGNGTINGTLNVGALGVADDLVVGDSIGTVRFTASSLISTTTYQLAGVNFAYRGSDVAGVLNTICDPAGFPAIDMYGVSGTYYRCDNAHSFTNRAATLNICRFQATDGVCQNASGAWSVFSDGALKENIEPLRSGLAEILKLKPVSFDYTKDAPFGAGTRRIGLVAQEVAEVLPEIVGETEIDGKTYASMEPGLLVFTLISAVQTLAARIDQLEGRKDV